MRCSRRGRAFFRRRHAGQPHRHRRGAAAIRGRDQFRSRAHQHPRNRRGGSHGAQGAHAAKRAAARSQPSRSGAAYDAHVHDVTHEHIVRPAMVYLSHPTELGTLYTRAELDAIHAVSQACGLKLFIDGARLCLRPRGGRNREPPLPGRHLRRLYHRRHEMRRAVWRGGGAEKREGLAAFPLPHQAARRALWPKGRLLAVQFQALDGQRPVRKRWAEKANAKARRIQQALPDKGFPMLCDTKANQIFPDPAKRRAENAATGTSAFAFWEAVVPRHTAVRICVSVTTPDANIAALLRAVEALSKPLIRLSAK